MRFKLLGIVTIGAVDGSLGVVAGVDAGVDDAVDGGESLGVEP
tara:strand:+ start:537 stop:665 length:129 start_codon:yes stop_codon:yes gene_type:complete